MMKGKITISKNGVVSVPDNVMMQDFVIAELFEVMIPAVRANIHAILKSGVVTADAGRGGVIFGNTILRAGYDYSSCFFGFNHGRQRYS